MKGRRFDGLVAVAVLCLLCAYAFPRMDAAARLWMLCWCVFFILLFLSIEPLQKRRRRALLAGRACLRMEDIAALPFFRNEFFADERRARLEHWWQWVADAAYAPPGLLRPEDDFHLIRCPYIFLCMEMDGIWDLFLDRWGAVLWALEEGCPPEKGELDTVGGIVGYCLRAEDWLATRQAKGENTVGRQNS